jgi:hypothetical protein
MAFITAPAFKIKSVSWSLDRPSQSNVSSWTGRRQVLTNPWHGKWSAKVELAPIVGEANVLAMRSFLARCRGSVNTFRLYATEGAQNANGGVTVFATAPAGNAAIQLTGYASRLLEGQFFTVNGQLCLCTADQDTGTSIVTFEPPLRQPAAAGTPVVTSRPYALVYLSSSTAGWDVGAGQVYGISFTVDEAILEADGAAPEISVVSGFATLREDGSYLLREDGSRILLEA